MKNVCVIDNTEFAPAEERCLIWTGDEILYARPSAISRVVANAKKAGLAIGGLRLLSRKPQSITSVSYDRLVKSWLDLTSIDYAKATVRDKDFLVSKLGPKVAETVWKVLDQNRRATEPKPRLIQHGATVDDVDLLNDTVIAVA